MSVFEELKRRKVFRLIAAYVVVAWVLIQVVTAIEEPLSLPDWFDTTIIVLLAVGFPIAVIMSWVYDVTPEGVVRDDDTGAQPIRIDYGKIALGAVLLLAAFLGGTWLNNSAFETRGSLQRSGGLQLFEMGVQSHPEVALEAHTQVAISDDGNTLVFSSGQLSNQRLFARSLDNLDFYPIPDSEGTGARFALSPDGQSVAVKRGSDRVFKVSTSSGVPVELGVVPGMIIQPGWDQDGSILLDGEHHDGLMRMPATGGQLELLTNPEEGASHKHPAPIPGTGAIAFVIGPETFAYDGSDRIAILTADGQTTMTGIQGATPKVSSDGHFVYFHDGALWAAEFDLDTLSLLSQPQPIVDDVSYEYTAHFDISSEGSLVYKRKPVDGQQSLVWVDRDGDEEPTGIGGSRFDFPSVSPDGEFVAVTVTSSYGIDLWTYSLDQGTPTRLTADEFRQTGPIWSPDGDYIYFESAALSDIYVISRNGVGGATAISVSEKRQWPVSLTPDGKFLFVAEGGPDTAGRFDIGLFDLAENRMIGYPVRTEFLEWDPMLSPNGNLLAYVSNVSGNNQVFVVPFPDTDRGAIQVSIEGARHPKWNEDGTELYYWGDEAIMMVTVNDDDGLSADSPVPLFSHAPYEFDGIGSFDYDPTRDRFMVVKEAPASSETDEIILIQQWPLLLQER